MENVTPDLELPLSDLSGRQLAYAIKANLYAFFRYFRYSTQAEYLVTDSLLRWHTQIPHPWFNGVLSLRPPGEAAQQVIEETIEYFRQKDVLSITWWLDSHLRLVDWGNYLKAQNFHYNDRTPGMAVEISKLPSVLAVPHSFHIEVVGDPERLRAWVETFVAGYDLPAHLTTPFYELVASLGLDLPFRYYLGYLDSAAVGASTFFAGSGVAGIYNVATRREARGLGIGKAMTVRPLLEAMAIGYRLGVLQSSELGFGVYQQLGFQKVCDMEHFYRVLV